MLKRILNEEYRKKKEVESLKSEKEKTIDRAKAVNLADGIYIVLKFNQKSSFNRKDKIDIYEVFKDESKELVDSWIKKVDKLLRDNHDVGDKVVQRASLSNRGDRVSYEMAQKSYDEAYVNFIKSNPGFSEDIYSDAIDQGARDAR